MWNNFSKLLLATLFSSLIYAPAVFADGNILINEVFVHPSSGGNEWVEIYNPDEIDITGHWIDDDINFESDSGSSSKKSLSSINQDNRKYMFVEISSVFNNSGDKIVLFGPGGNVLDQYEYSSDPGSDISIGRSPDGNGQFLSLSSPTRGQVNSGAAPTPTPTPQDTPTPTKTPTVTKIPTSTKTPTSGKSIYSATTSKTPTLAPSASRIATNAINKTSKLASLSGIPTSILGTSSKSAIMKQAEDNRNKTLVDSANKRNITPFIIIGALFMLACGILVLRNRRKSRHV